ncbi:MAG: TIGR03086 family protein [Nocardia sp.]|nr:TIGR03086 family protein [Nocardia sp.]
MHTNIVEFDATAVRASADLVAGAGPADWSRPTPCAGWTLRDLVAHMATQHYGFAAAVHGDGALSRWKLRSLGEHPITAYRESADVVLAAFAAEDVLTRRFPLPEFGDHDPFPAPLAISFHFIDYVVHSWDVATALGRTVEFAPDVLTAALEVARLVPTGQARTGPGAAFAPEVPYAGENTLDRIAALLGRNPAERIHR